jgi:hypothetical protein
MTDNSNSSLSLIGVDEREREVDLLDFHDKAFGAKEKQVISLPHVFSFDMAPSCSYKYGILFAVGVGNR